MCANLWRAHSTLCAASSLSHRICFRSSLFCFVCQSLHSCCFEACLCSGCCCCCFGLGLGLASRLRCITAILRLCVCVCCVHSHSYIVQTVASKARKPGSWAQIVCCCAFARSSGFTRLARSLNFANGLAFSARASDSTPSVRLLAVCNASLCVCVTFHRCSSQRKRLGTPLRSPIRADVCDSRLGPTLHNTLLACPPSRQTPKLLPPRS